MVEKEKRVRILKKVIQIIPWVIGLLLILAISFVLAHDTDITAEELARYAPKNDWLAAVFLIVLYAVKSLTYVLPIPLLYISSGLIFRPAVAFLVNVLGMTVCISLPYWIGRYSGGGMIKKLMKRFPKLQLLDNFKSDNEWFFSFIVRVIGFFPCDAVSVFMGAFHVDFKKYVTGTVVGMKPGLIATTLVGITITDPHSPEFLFSCLLSISTTIASLVVYRVHMKSRGGTRSRSALSAEANSDLRHESKEREPEESSQR